MISKECLKCGESLEVTEDNFYLLNRRKRVMVKGVLVNEYIEKYVDSYCKPCRKAISRERQRAKILGEPYSINHDQEDRRRDTPELWKSYMQDNPIYFTGVWGLPPTSENINRTALEMFGGYRSDRAGQ